MFILSNLLFILHFDSFLTQKYQKTIVLALNKFTE